MVSNKLNALISLTGLLWLLCSCSSAPSDHADRMAKLRADHETKYRDDLAAQEDSLHWADSTLLLITPVVNDMIAEGRFVYVKNEFDEEGRFVADGSEADDNLDRNYLHAAVTENGRCQLISEYRGGSRFNHVQIIAEGGDGTRMSSQIVPLSSTGANYRFENQGIFHETVTFLSDSVMAYLDLHATDTKLKYSIVDEKGRKRACSITAADRRNLSHAYRLSQVLTLQLHCSQLSKISSEKITLLKTKLEANTQQNNNQ